MGNELITIHFENQLLLNDTNTVPSKNKNQ